METELTVAEVVESDDDGEPTAAEAEDGLAAQDALTNLFVSADRLMKDPKAGHEAQRFTDATERLSRLGLPYGFSSAVWGDLKAKAGELSELLAGDSDDDAVTEAATTLRHTLRQYV